MNIKNQNIPKLLFVSSPGGHFDQLMMLQPLMKKYKSIIVTEKISVANEANYYMLKTGYTDKFILPKMVLNCIYAFFIFIKERPTHMISTGAFIALPFALISKVFGSKIIFIETFARTNDKSKTGRFMYKISDLFIVQWEDLLEIYPNAIYGGSIY